jgi:glycosyltransferase involved in cell wall biosynthesis
MPRLTVLICTHDRAHLLAKALDSLRSAARPQGWQVDVLVAANACTDGTHDLLERRAAGGHGALGVSWFAEPKPGKSNALNSAMPRITSDVVAFVDDDHRVDHGYLQAICAAADAYPDADIFCGRVLPDWDGTEPAWVHDRGPYRIYPLPVPHYELGDQSRPWRDEDPVPGGGNLFMRTPWLGRVGCFATELGPTGHNLAGSEDKDWMLRALALGARLHYVPQVVQYHHVEAQRLTLGYVVKKAYMRSASSIAVNRQLPPGPVPGYLYRKAMQNALKAGTALGSARRRFYLVRTAAALGEIAGHLRRRRRPPGAPGEPVTD